MYKQSSRSNCSMAGCFHEKLRWCLIEQFCQGIKCKTMNNAEVWILSYVRSYLKHETLPWPEETVSAFISLSSPQVCLIQRSTSHQDLAMTRTGHRAVYRSHTGHKVLTLDLYGVE